MNSLNTNSYHSPHLQSSYNQPTWLPRPIHNLISVQSTGRTHSSSLVTLARPSVSSSLQVTNRSFTYASPYLWNQLPSSFRQPHSVHSPPGSPYPAHITSSQFPSWISPSITPSAFHSGLKSLTVLQCLKWEQNIVYSTVSRTRVVPISTTVSGVV